MTILLMALFSVFLGSFYNVCIHRAMSGESIVYPPSHCPECRHPLAPLDLIPILSYIFLLGKCRYCKAKISIRYPIIELITAVLVLLLYNAYGLTWQFVSYTFLTGLLIIVSFIDIEQQFIPNKLVVIGFIFGVLFSLAGFTTQFWNAILGLISGAGSLLIIGLVSLLVLRKEGMGGGDIKLLGVIGLFLGWKLTLLTLFVSIYIGGIFSIFLLLLGIKNKGEYIAFGPFISLASLIALLWGRDIIQWYVVSFL